MFTGLDKIDWAAMQHAYGPADEVPDLLRGLVSHDPAERESALDGMYGAVHHQGDVYRCTVAAIPFLLEAAADPRVPGRAGIVELLGSIGGAASDEQPQDSEYQEDDLVMYWGTANRSIAGAGPLFLDLLADPDPRVRAAAATALLTWRTEAARVAAALRDRLPDEPDPAVRAAIVASAGTIGRRAAAGLLDGVDTAALTGWLVSLSGEGTDNPLRLAALAEVARYAPDALPADVALTAVALLRQVYVAGTAPVEPAGYSTNTLIGSIREMREQEAAGREAADAAELVRSLSVSLGERVDDRVRLLTELLRAPEWEARYDALRPAGVLIGGWRGEYTELVQLIGERLFDPHPRVPSLAAQALEHTGDLARPAADALVRALEAAPREASHRRNDGLPAWVTVWPDDAPSPGSLLQVLTAMADPRALPAVQWVLEQPRMAGDAGMLAARYGARAAYLVPTIVQRLRDVPTVDGHDRRRYGLITALGQIGEAAGPAVPHLIPRLPDDVTLAALGRIGAAAAEAAPAVRYLLGDGKPSTEIAAARTLWRITGDPEPSLAVLVRHLDGDAHAIRGAAEAIAEIGPAAASAVPKIRTLTRAEQWTQLALARALWRVAGDPAAAVPQLLSLWTANAYVRKPVAECLAEMGPAAAPAVPLIREELARRRRHTASDHGWSSNQVTSDLELLTACRAVLAGTVR